MKLRLKTFSFSSQVYEAPQPVTRSRNRRNSNIRTISDIKHGMKERLKTLGRKIKKSNDYIANIHGPRVMYYDYWDLIKSKCPRKQNQLAKEKKIEYFSPKYVKQTFRVGYNHLGAGMLQTFDHIINYMSNVPTHLRKPDFDKVYQILAPNIISVMIRVNISKSKLIWASS